MMEIPLPKRRLWSLTLTTMFFYLLKALQVFQWQPASSSDLNRVCYSVIKAQSTEITTAVKKTTGYLLDYSTSHINFHFSSLANSSSKQKQHCLITTVKTIYLYLGMKQKSLGRVQRGLKWVGGFSLTPGGSDQSPQAQSNYIFQMRYRGPCPAADADVNED